MTMKRTIRERLAGAAAASLLMAFAAALVAAMFTASPEITG